MAEEKKKKYVTNTLKIAYQFQNGIVLGKKKTIIIDESKLEELKKDFMFRSLLDSKSIKVSENKPKSLDSAASDLASKDEEIKNLREQLAEKNKMLAEISATSGDDDKTETTLDTEEQPVSQEVVVDGTSEREPQEGETPKKKSGKK